LGRGAAGTSIFELTGDHYYSRASPHTETEEQDGFFISVLSVCAWHHPANSCAILITLACWETDIIVFDLQLNAMHGSLLA